MNKKLKPKFITTIDQLLKEQGPPPPPGAGQQSPAPEGPPQEDVPTEPEGPTEPEIDVLSPESEVMLVRLLKKAMVMELDPEDINMIDSIDDINERSSKAALKMIVDVMKKYSTQIDIQ